jgi:hypothetical protein
MGLEPLLRALPAIDIEPAILIEQALDLYKNTFHSSCQGDSLGQPSRVFHYQCVISTAGRNLSKGVGSQRFLVSLEMTSLVRDLGKTHLAIPLSFVYMMLL